jgi:hypothetical protein
MIDNVFNATFNTNTAISWRSVLLVEETRGPDENYGIMRGGYFNGNNLLHVMDIIH